MSTSIYLMCRKQHTCSTQRRQPDHDLVLFTAIRRRSSEKIVRNVGLDVTALVAPLPLRRDRRDIRQLGFGEVVNSVVVGLDRSRGTGPRPSRDRSASPLAAGQGLEDSRRSPSDAIARGAVEGEALAATARTALSPKVIRKDVRPSSHRSPLGALAGAGTGIDRFAGRQRGQSGCQSCEGQKGGDAGHVDVCGESDVTRLSFKECLVNYQSRR